MSGHSRWTTTRHRKATIDTKRDKFFAHFIKNVEVAARTGGGDPTGSPTLFGTIQRAKKNSVSTDNTTRAVRRGNGEEAGDVNWQTIMYEGYGPDGTTFLAKRFTDNRSRAVSDVRVASSRDDGNLADPGSVAYSFTRKGVIEAAKTDDVDENSTLMAILEADTEEVEDMDESSEVHSGPGDIVTACTTLTEAGMDYDPAEVQFVVGAKVGVDIGGAHKAFRLINALGGPGGVQNVCTSVDLSLEVAAEFAGDED